MTTRPFAAGKLTLTIHVTASVGWLGAVAGFVALAVAGVASEDVETVRAVYIAMELLGWFVLVPLSFASLISGIVQSLRSKWGLFRHYWVVFKLAINVLATGVLLLYTQTLGSLADLARATPAVGGDVDRLRSASPLLHGAAALVLLVVATVLAVYKPRGLTRWGRRAQRRTVADEFKRSR